jgi:hypothetical protein
MCLVSLFAVLASAEQCEKSTKRNEKQRHTAQTICRIHPAACPACPCKRSDELSTYELWRLRRQRENDALGFGTQEGQDESKLRAKQVVERRGPITY